VPHEALFLFFAHHALHYFVGGAILLVAGNLLDCLFLFFFKKNEVAHDVQEADRL
jgi:hypothetical protein